MTVGITIPAFVQYANFKYGYRFPPHARVFLTCLHCASLVRRFFGSHFFAFDRAPRNA